MQVQSKKKNIKRQNVINSSLIRNTSILKRNKRTNHYQNIVENLELALTLDFGNSSTVVDSVLALVLAPMLVVETSQWKHQIELLP